jgi:Astacin (Peptidase family M12A)
MRTRVGFASLILLVVLWFVAEQPSLDKTVKALQHPHTAPQPAVSQNETQPKATASLSPPQTVMPVVDLPPNESPGERGLLAFRRVGEYVVAHGDIILGKPTIEDFPETGFIEASPVKLWPSREIAFSIEPDLPRPERVLEALETFMKRTPIVFVPYSNQKDSIVFTRGSELCSSYLGHIGGHQPIYLEDRCETREVKHEIMHALGLVHEHARPDRDTYVAVDLENVSEGLRGQFEQVPKSLWPLEGRPFDPSSIMIYESFAFALDRSRPTIMLRTGLETQPAKTLSEEDVARIVTLYGNK